MSNVVEQIVHFQRKLEKYSATNETDKLLYYIHKLKHLSIKVSHLEVTGVGRSVNALRQQHRGIVADKAKALVNKWKELLDDDEEEEEEEEEEYEPEDEEENDNHEPDSTLPIDDTKPYAGEEQESDSGGDDNEEEDDGRLQIEEDQDPDNQYVGYSSTEVKTNQYDYHPQSMNYSDSEREEGDDGDSYNPLTSQRDYLSQSSLARSEYHPSACRMVDEPDEPEAVNSPQWRDASPDESSDRRNGNSPKASSSKKSTKSDKERSKDRDRHKDRGKDKHKESSRSHDKEKKKERKEKHRHRDREEREEKKSHKDKHKDKDRHTDKVKEDKHKSEEYKERAKPDKPDERYIANGFSSPEIEERSYSNKKELRESDKRGMDEKRKVKSDRSGGGSGSSVLRKDNSSHRDSSAGSTPKESRLSDSREENRTPKHSNGREKLSVSNSSSGSSSSGSGSKDRGKERKREEKHRDRDRNKSDKKDRHKKESKDKKLIEDQSKSMKKDKVKKGMKADEDMGFGAALMGLDSPVKKKKKKKKKDEAERERESSDDEKPSTSLSSSKRSLTDAEGKPGAKKPKLLSESSQRLPKLPLSIPDDAAFLPEITPNYKPLPRVAVRDEVDSSLAKMTDEEALNFMFQSKNKRSKVYSGRVTGLSFVPTLYESCIRVLQENIDGLEATGGIPFEILRPVLERADPRQLMTLEDYNAYLLQDTNVLWEVHCKRDFKNKKLEEMETWREMWLRCSDERDRKLRSITQSLSKKFVSNSEPKRTTKLAFVDTNIKVPKSVARAQAKYGTAPSPAAAKGGKASEVAARKTAMLNTQRAERAANPRPTPAKNKKVAPLMAKTRQFYKKAFRR